MSENPGSELGAFLRLQYDKAAQEATLAAVSAVKKATEDLAKGNKDAASSEAEATKATEKAIAAQERAAAAHKKVGDAAKQEAVQVRSVLDIVKQFERQKEIDELANKWAKVAKQTKNAADAAKGLQADLAKKGASQFEIESAGATLAAGGSGARNALARAGSELRALPSQRIPGLNIGTDAIGNFLRLGGAIKAASEGSTLLSGATAALTPALGASAASFVVLAGPVIAIAAAVKLAGDAFAAASAQIEAAKEGLRAQIEAERAVLEFVNSGATVDDAKKRLEELQKTLETENQILEENRARQKKGFEDAQKDASGAFDGIGNALAGLTGSQGDIVKQATGDVTAFGDAVARAGTATGAFSDVDEAVTKAGDNATKTQKEIDELTKQIEAGAFAANDAAAAEEKLAAERTKAVLDQAAAAGQEESSRRKALNASEEQNQARLKAIEDERASVNAQLNVLKSSGDTSAEVAEQIAKLNGQLGALGKESSFIKDTALGVARQRDAEKKAQKDREKAQEDATRKQEAAEKKRYDAGVKFSQKLSEIARTAADKAADNLTSMKDKLAHNETDFLRDIDKLGRDAAHDRTEAQIKEFEEQAKDFREHSKELDKIQAEAERDETKALRKRNFLQAAEIREAAIARMEAEISDFESAQDEKEAAASEARAKDDRELEYARESRLISLKEQNQDARTAYEEANRDAKIAQDRARRDAAIAKNQELSAANEHANNLLNIRQAMAKSEVSIFQNALSTISAMQPGFAPPQSAYGNGSGTATVYNSGGNKSIGNVNNTFTGSITSPTVVQKAILKTMSDLGYE